MEQHETRTMPKTARTRDRSDGTSPLAARAVELYIDGAVAGRATTDGEGAAKFTHKAPVHGPFDLAKVVLAEDRSVASNEILLSWPMGTRGVDSDNSWQLVWSDEFNGTSLDTVKWKAASIRFYVDDQRVLTVPSSDWFYECRPPSGSAPGAGQGCETP